MEIREILNLLESVESGVAEGSASELKLLIQQYEDQVENVYGMVPGKRYREAIAKRDALEARIEALPGGRAALEKWARSYNDAMDESVSEGLETEADIDKKIEFHKQGQAAAQYKGAMNKMHAKKIRELLAKKEALKKQGAAEDALEETQQVEEDPVARVEQLARELQNR